MTTHHVFQTEGDLEAWARAFAPTLGQGDCVLLEGPLGAGKTTLCRALVRTLMGDDTLTVPSPTFTLVQVYEADDVPVWHFDFYRLEGADLVEEVGLDQALEEGIALVEWPSRVAWPWPQRTFRLTLMVDPETAARHLRVETP
jgi:tRNA threonylcarbamoyl adenosine modification protein YjeE